MFGDPRQHKHMIAGVKRALSSPFTPPHLRQHLNARLGGSMKPIKTIVGPTGRTPIKTFTRPTYGTTPPKVIVGSTAQPPRKTIVGSTAAPPRKTIVGSTAAPPLKQTPATLGKGSNNPFAVRPEAINPNSAANVSLNSRSIGRSDGNLGRNVAPMPGPASGPPNPIMQWNKPQGESAIVPGGMGQTIPNMRPKRSRRTAGSQTNDQFFGG